MPPTTEAPPKQRISTTGAIVFLAVIVLSFLLYHQTVQSYLNDPATILYNTLVVADVTMNNETIVDTAFDIPDDAAYQRFLTLTDASTARWRAWLNASLTQAPGATKYDHDASTKSTVVYKACCGLGHRLTRLEDAAHVAMLYDATLEVQWNDCGADTFQRLFGNEPLRLREIQSNGYSWTFSNDVPRCYGMADPNLCRAIEDGKVKAAQRMYQALLDRYLRRNVVEEFIQKHFGDGLTSIGMHIRAGNNETGDFTRKQRDIADMDAFVKINTHRIQSMTNGTPAVLFIATDTPSYVDAFRVALNDTMNVVELEQFRAQEGSGVLFGEHGAPKPTGEDCLEGWHAALQDMMILASTDIVFASTYSSFTRTMPRVMALTRSDRPGRKSFCENWMVTSSQMVCYASIDEFKANPPPMKRRRW